MIEEPPRMPRTVTFKVERCKECRPAPCFVCEPRAGGTPGRHFSGSTETVHEAGISVRGRAISESVAGPLEDHILDDDVLEH